MAQLYRVIVRVPFIFNGRLIPRGEVLELSALDALARTHQNKYAEFMDEDRPAPPPQKRRRKKAAA